MRWRYPRVSGLITDVFINHNSKHGFCNRSSSGISALKRFPFTHYVRIESKYILRSVNANTPLTRALCTANINAISDRAWRRENASVRWSTVWKDNLKSTKKNWLKTPMQFFDLNKYITIFSIWSRSWPSWRCSYYILFLMYNTSVQITDFIHHFKCADLTVFFYLMFVYNIH